MKLILKIYQHCENTEKLINNLVKLVVKAGVKFEANGDYCCYYSHYWQTVQGYMT